VNCVPLLSGDGTAPDIPALEVVVLDDIFILQVNTTARVLVDDPPQDFVSLGNDVVDVDA
jgi:hypothetical protein